MELSNGGSLKWVNLISQKYFVSFTRMGKRDILMQGTGKTKPRGG